jgi:hypothetical protein
VDLVFSVAGGECGAHPLSFATLDIVLHYRFSKGFCEAAIFSHGCRRMSREYL